MTTRIRSTGLSIAELAEIRELFPIVKDYTFLNSASMAPLPTPSATAVSQFVAELSSMAYLGMEKWIETIGATRKKAATLIGAKPNEIAFIRNTSDGVSLVASGLDLKRGDEVIINDLEFPSNVYPWLNLMRKGVVVKTVKSEGGRVTEDMIAIKVTSRTKVIAISTVQYSSGYRADLSAIGALAREANAWFFVDAIQSLGLIPLDVKEHNIDFLACGGHKWLCAPEGIGIFYVDEKNLDALTPTRVGWHSVVNAIDFGNIDFTLKPDAERFEEGTANRAGIFGLLASLETVTAHGVSNNFAHVLGLNDRLYQGLEKAGCEILSPVESDKERSGITIFSTGSDEKNRLLSKKLNAANILVIHRGAGIRVSPHFFNNNDDIDRLIKAL